MRYVFYLMIWFPAILIPDSQSIAVTTVLPKMLEVSINQTRRILKGQEITDSRPYMVYLKLPPNNDKHENYRGWVCGGVIVHEQFVLTSAACVQDAEHFYVVSGTYRYTPDENPDDNECIKNGQKKAIWKCVPKDYFFDGHANDNIRWLHNDIAVVRVEDPFSFTHKVKGCDFIPQMVAYNNHSKELENEGTKASVAGWGTTRAFRDWTLSRRDEASETTNTINLLEAEVELIDKERCKKNWGQRYMDAIEKYMICTKDAAHDPFCEDDADCHDIDFKDNEGGRRAMGGFCENDHGGPLLHGYGPNSEVIGIIAAPKVKERTLECYGPFLYTSVFYNRHFINCAIDKSTEKTCLLRFRPGVDVIETAMQWDGHPDGPAKRQGKVSPTIRRDKPGEEREEMKSEKFEWNTALIQKP